MKTDIIKNLFDFLPKSKIKAGDGLETGLHPFYTSSENQVKYLNKHLYEPDCLVFGTGGKANVHFSSKKFSTSTDCIVIKPKINAKINAEYVFFYLKSNMHVVEKGFKGSGLKHISKLYISEIEIPIRENEEQIKIVGILKNTNNLIINKKIQIYNLDKLIKSIFFEMFGDPLLNKKRFQIRNLSDFYINKKNGIKCGPFGSTLKKCDLDSCGIPVFGIDNIGSNGRINIPFSMWINEDKYNALRCYSVSEGDIIISRAGTVGKMCVARMNGSTAIISTNLIRLRLGPELLPLYFVSLMTYCKDRVGRLKTGAEGAFTHMNTGVLDKLAFPCPPLELQNQFAAIVEKVEAVRSCCTESLADLEKLHASLSHKAFKGELDLSKAFLPAESGAQGQ